MIADSFEYGNGTVDIHLTDEGDKFLIQAKWQGGGYVNGYEYAVDKLTRIDAYQVSTLDPVKTLIAKARDDVETEQWKRYQDALKQLSEELLEFEETHIFDLGMPGLEFINVTITNLSTDIDAATQQAQEARCSLAVSLNQLVLIRNGDTIPLSESQITFDGISEQARTRLNEAGCPLDIREEGAAKKALEGLQNGSMTISDSDLERVELSMKGLLEQDNIDTLISHASHLGYGVKSGDVNPMSVVTRIEYEYL